MDNLTNSIAKRLEATMTCKKCGGKMKRGVAIENTWQRGMSDFGDDIRGITMTAGGSGKLVTCLKCESCGWSYGE